MTIPLLPTEIWEAIAFSLPSISDVKNLSKASNEFATLGSPDFLRRFHLRYFGNNMKRAVFYAMYFFDEDDMRKLLYDVVDSEHIFKVDVWALERLISVQSEFDIIFEVDTTFHGPLAEKARMKFQRSSSTASFMEELEKFQVYLLDKLLKHGIGIDLERLMLRSITYGNFLVAEYIIRSKGLNMDNIHISTGVYLAMICDNRLDIMKLLLKSGARITNDAPTVAQLLVQKQRYGILTLVLNSLRPDPQMFEAAIITSWTTAVNEDRLEMLELLMGKFQVNADFEQNIAMRRACRKGNVGMLKLLLSHGLSIQRHANEALCTAICHNRPEIVSLLIDYKINIHVQQEAPLREACYRGHLDIVRILCEEGNADIRACHYQAFLSARQGGHDDVLFYLRQRLKNLKLPQRRRNSIA